MKHLQPYPDYKHHHGEPNKFKGGHHCTTEEVKERFEDEIEDNERKSDDRN